MEGPYIIEFGDVWLEPARGRGTRTHVCDGTEELAIAFSDDVRHKMGSARSVDAWMEKNGQVPGFDITVVRIPVSPETVAELNACYHNSTRIAGLLERLAEMGERHPELEQRPRFPR